MTATRKPLADDAARSKAVSVHDRSFLVEAGAGSGKTAVLAGRIAMLLAGGIEPRSIAAVTFTEFAASELLVRVREFVGELAASRIPAELVAAFPGGITDDRRSRLAEARETLDDLACSTIHGFCQRLIAPYPVEADIDPGASIMDSDQADLAFSEIVKGWLREELAGEAGGLLPALVLHDPRTTVRLIETILDHYRRHRVIAHDAPGDLTPLADDFREAVGSFEAFLSAVEVEEADTVAIAGLFRELSEEYGAAPEPVAWAAHVRLLAAELDAALVTGAGSFRQYRKKGRWIAAAGDAGLSRADGEQLNARAEAHYARCCAAWSALRQSAASRVLSGLVRFVRPVMERFRHHKRSAALLDFDDLIFAARDLLRDHDPVRRALAGRYRHVLVDEFQDTDPLQTEIFWRLCGERLPGADAGDWTSFALRPGALFLVGDPKQAIYRFRGADITAYVRAREAFAAQAPEGVLPISTNFRSCPEIMRFVNRRFEKPLSEDNGQPGFRALDPFRAERSARLSVAALDIAVADDDGKATALRRRDGEAEAVAEMCVRLIGAEPIADPKTGGSRACRAGDIALLAPTGNDLWRYEEALERRGIPVATQAGKGLFGRQEIQDLIAVTRVLADRRDTLALGALLRGPLVGLTEEELLDIVWQLPRPEHRPDVPARLDLGVQADFIPHPLARDILEKLQVIRRRVNATTPHELLSQAVDVLRVRPILLQRHGGRAERALANVDLYLGFSRAYAVRGLRAFAESMTAAWTDEARAVEGRPDAQEEAVALYTMHAAKGLEWPVVVPVNTMTQVRKSDSAVTDRASGRFFCPVFGVDPLGCDEARDAENAELDRERVRLWYVAATRARELLVLPRLDVDAGASAWLSVVDLALDELPALELEPAAIESAVDDARDGNEQTRELFAAEAGAIREQERTIVWRAPSRDEGASGPVVREEEPEILADDGDGAPVDGTAATPVQGGLDRGLILHKLIEEVLTGETAETLPGLEARAESLIRELGRTVQKDAALGLNPAELAGCVVRTLSLPEIAAIRSSLVAELPVYASTAAETGEEAVAGIADAIALDAQGRPRVVVDWKSDVDPSPDTIDHYRAQVRTYLDMTGAKRGLIVMMTGGRVIEIRGRG